MERDDMNLNLTADDAKYLLAGFGVLIPIVIAWLPTIKVADYLKFLIVAVLSIVGGYLTVLATEQLVTGGTLVQNAALVFTASQLFYYGAFRALGLEKVLFPQQALATEAKEKAKDATPENLSNAQAKDVLDPSTPPTLAVTTAVVNK